MIWTCVLAILGILFVCVGNILQHRCDSDKNKAPLRKYIESKLTISGDATFVGMLYSYLVGWLCLIAALVKLLLYFIW